MTPTDREQRVTLDADEVAALIGCSAAHVRRLAQRGAFPQPLRLGARVVWSRAVVLAFLNGGSNPATNYAALPADAVIAR